MRLPVRFVCAFSNAPHQGNPAAVVMLDDMLEEGRMQAIASELAQPVTAFVAAARSPTESAGTHRPSRIFCAATARLPRCMRPLKAAAAASAYCALSIAPAR